MCPRKELAPENPHGALRATHSGEFPFIFECHGHRDGQGRVLLVKAHFQAVEVLLDNRKSLAREHGAPPGVIEAATVELATETVGTADYKRKVEEVAGLDEGKVIVKQKGIRGLSLRKTRTIHLGDGRDKVEITTDVYPPTFEILKVSPGTDPESLPPLPQDKRTAENEAAPSIEGKPGTAR